jgi:hypothetical protein
MRDEESGADVTACDRTVGELFLSISIAEFASQAAAAAALKQVEKMSIEVEEAVNLGPDAGPGQAALWGANDDGAMWVVREGKYMLNVTLAGEGTGRYKEQLKRLTTSAVAKL